MLVVLLLRLQYALQLSTANIRTSETAPSDFPSGRSPALRLSLGSRLSKEGLNQTFGV